MGEKEYIVVHGWIGLPNGVKAHRGEKVTESQLGVTFERHRGAGSIKPMKEAPKPEEKPPETKVDEKPKMKGFGKK